MEKFMPVIIGGKPINYMNKKAVILAAGSGERWGNYLGVPKQLIKIDGESLLFRTIRQIKERGISEVIVTVPKKGYFGEIPAKEIVGSRNVEIDKILNARDYAGSLLFWGDVFFTDKAMDIILSDKNDFRFFGRKRGSKLTGKNYGELFAIKVNQALIDKAEELKSMAPKLKRCASWEFYRLVCGYPLDKHIVGEHFTEIDDFTDDFDYPKDYDNWIKKYENKTR